MGVLDWIIVGVIVIAMIGVVVYTVTSKKKGKSTCGGCSACLNFGKCASCDKKNEDV